MSLVQGCNLLLEYTLQCIISEKIRKVSLIDMETFWELIVFILSVFLNAGSIELIEPEKENLALDYFCKLREF